MAGTVLITVEGVLGAPQAAIGAPEAVEGPLRPIREGISMFHALRAHFRVALSTDSTHLPRLEQWLQLNGVTTERYDRLYEREPVDADLDRAGLRARHLERLRASWGDVAMVLDPDPAVVLNALHQGVVGLLFATPMWARPEWRPDSPKGVKAWAQIEAEVTRRRELKEGS